MKNEFRGDQMVWQKKKEKLKESDLFLKDIHKNLSHKIMLPLNSVCFVPAVINSTNNVRFY